MATSRQDKPTTWADVKGELKLQAFLLFGMFTTFWVVFLMSAATGGALNTLGIHPRSIDTLYGILFSPFLHGNLAHIISNSGPFLVMGGLVMARDTRHFVAVTLAGILGGGIVAWTIGAPGSVHIGASGVVFAYFGFLLMGGWFQRSVGTILVSLAVAVAWGGLVFGVLPGQPGISWEAHLGGFLGGAMVARWVARLSQRGIK